MKQEPPRVALHLGNAARMPDLGDQSVNLIVTSPPYFPVQVESMLAVPREEQTRFDDVERAVLAFALSLRPAFAEMRRVLRPDGVLVMQTKDLRYGSWLIALADAHTGLALQVGLHLIGKVAWAPKPVNVRRVPGFARAPRVGNYRPVEVEWFIVFGNTVEPKAGSRLLGGRDLVRLADPLWRSPPSQRRHRHPYGSPPDVVRQWIELYTEPGDLVVDPFAGYGTTVAEAERLGRRAMGYEIDPAVIAASGAEVAP